MLYPFLKIDQRNITYSEIKKINGQEQIRIYSDEPNKTTKKFNELEFYLPNFNITKLVGFTKQDVMEIMKHVKNGEEVIWELARDEKNA